MNELVHLYILYSVMVKYQIVLCTLLLTFDILFVLKHNIDKSNIRHKIKQLLKPFYFLNKSFSYQDTLPLRSLLVCILNFDNKTSNIFSKCNHLSGRYLGEKHFVHKSRAVTRLKNKEKQNVIG